MDASNVHILDVLRALQDWDVERVRQLFVKECETDERNKEMQQLEGRLTEERHSADDLREKYEKAIETNGQLYAEGRRLIDSLTARVAQLESANTRLDVIGKQYAAHVSQLNTEANHLKQRNEELTKENSIVSDLLRNKAYNESVIQSLRIKAESLKSENDKLISDNQNQKLLIDSFAKKMQNYENYENFDSLDNMIATLSDQFANNDSPTVQTLIDNTIVELLSND